MIKFLLKTFVKDYEKTEDKEVRVRYGVLGGILGIICNLFLFAVKLFSGIFMNSIAIISDSVNNLSDTGSSVVTLVGSKLSGMRPDKDHPFGHGRIEYLSAFIVSMLILLVGFELLKSSVQAIVEGKPSPTYTVISYIILICSVAVKLWMYFFNKKLGKKISSDALLATAQDCLNDSVATTVILIAALVTGSFSLPFNLDAVMGILVGAFIIYSGIMTAKETVDKLLGQPPSEELLRELEKTIMSFSDFEAIHDLIVHNYGPGRCLASVHVEVSQHIDIVHCHEQADLCEKLVGERLGVELTIHTDPIDTKSEEVVGVRTRLNEKIKTLHPDATIHDFRMTPMGETRTNLIFDAVLPGDAKLSEQEFKEKIKDLAKEINETFVCVITVDRDFTGK